MHRPIIGITMGDAAGVGPEIIMKALKDPQVFETCKAIVIGDAKFLSRAELFLQTGLRVHSIKSPEQALDQAGIVNCLDMDLLPESLPYGKVSPQSGDAAFRFLEKSIELAKKEKIDAICTAPLNKEALQKGGHHYPGHTEILADLTATSDYAMMLSSPKLKVIHVTTHMGLIDAVKSITAERVYSVIKMAHDTLKKAGYEQPRICVCGINPHAGENGLFGYGEEDAVIVPAVERAKQQGINVVGPLPADTLFFLAVRGDYDIVVAMYHDQGHGPIKVLGLDAGVNITVGLPIIRTSVDHGTAFDIAGKGIADEKSLLEAIRQGIELAPKR
ncbi:4-hydroxythreonine-4-phosphate dehydrogenase PdxA [Paenibacillus sp. FSL H7-0331]|uniref:4-hydroxythreonine-4-phosphate dehydrogenase PdxA n=1 Tax=Paenibacillus sp. FSL H7-0331 TaxID=1920421 RepID=UPI00096D3A39|nr:4-hydroxythreonine-4-phosphate dehydrogenase PdxA [Paenibacillus sp. FSL H7-0331]OMF20866.1 4-hydroxythreonine-4-phosphate dehydrogenase PdxA [Paenibacillus sp. FSL H7-0331]